MNRDALADQIQRIRRAENRSPEDAAFYALCSLPIVQMMALVARYNATFSKCSPPHTMTLEEMK